MDMPSLSKNPYIAKEEKTTSVLPDSLLGTFDTKHFVIGALVGALGAYLLTNEKAQKAIFKTVAKGTQAFQAGIEEMKERYEDAKAELAASES
jgi:hypothetical protein